MSKILFFTCCNKAYEDFVLLFILGILKTIDDALIEVGVEDSDSFKEKYSVPLSFLKKRFGRDRFLIRTVEFFGDPAAVRFFINPVLKAEYVYITDVDVINMKSNVLEVHLKEMKQSGLPYNNMVREGTQRMTGMHFTLYNAHYPLTQVPKILASANKMMNEEILYYAVVSKGLPLPKKETRPMFGIHISPKRHATHKKVGWDIQDYRDEWKAFRSSKETKTLYEFFSGRVKNCIDLIDYIVQ